MDTSETFIKMCEKSEEVQGQRIIGQPYEEGDFWTFLNKGSKRRYDKWFVSSVGLEHSNEYGVEIRRSHHIWLPRQDQLQELMKLPLDELIEAFVDKIGASDYSWMDSEVEPWQMYGEIFGINWKQITSMEQLWLAFVMSERFGKVWSGKEWINV